MSLILANMTVLPVAILAQYFHECSFVLPGRGFPGLAFSFLFVAFLFVAFPNTVL